MSFAGRWTSLVTTFVLVVLIAVVVAWLRATAPATTTDVSVSELLPDDAPLACTELEADDPDGGPGDDTADDTAGATAETATDDGASPGGDPVGRAVSGEVLRCPFAFDGLLVTYIGEAVGDVLRRDGGSWVLVNDDPYALEQGPLAPGGTPAGTNSGLTVWLPDGLDELADEPGRADRRGDVLHIVGTVTRADPADGGGLTIRAQRAEVLAEAAPVEVPVHWNQVAVAAVLAALAVLLLLRERREREW